MALRGFVAQIGLRIHSFILVSKLVGLCGRRTLLKTYKLSAIAVGVGLALAGCATPLEQCLSNAQRDYQDVLAAITATETNIDRGYAVHRQSVPYTYQGVCYHVDVGNYSCPQTGYRTQETPVAIDINAEKIKLRTLRRSVSALQRSTEDASRQCRATYPE